MKSLLALTLFCLAAPTWAQTTWYVDASAQGPGAGTQQDPFSELQPAIAQGATVDGDTVRVAAGTYVGPFDFLGKEITVQGSGADSTTLDGAGQPGSVVSFVGGEGPAARLQGFTVTGGLGRPSAWQPTLNDREGGGILCEQSSPTLANLVITQNRAGRGAGILFLDSSATLTNSELRTNLGDNCCCFGLGIFSDSPSVRIESCLIEDHGAGTAFYGGGLFGQATVIDTRFFRNGGASGGAIFSIGCVVEDCTFRDNFQIADTVQIIGSGAAISHLGPDDGGFNGFPGFLEVPTVVRNSVFTGNLAAIGGAVASYDPAFLAVTGSEFYGNETRVLSPGDGFPGPGGAAYRATVTDCFFSGNAAEQGGAVHECIATRCRMTGNTARKGTDPQDPDVLGGGAAFDSDLIDCVLSYNSVVPSTAAPFAPEALGGGSVGGTAIRTVYFRNVAEVGGGAVGGDFESCTFVGNRASKRGGSLASISFGGDRPVTALNVIAFSDSADEIFSAAQAPAVATFSNVRGSFPGQGNFDADPLFFGPEAGDFRLKPGSPCIDTGDPNLSDPGGSRSDVGAFPFDPSYTGAPTSWCVSKVNSLGCRPTTRSEGTPSLSGPDDFMIIGEDFIGASFGLMFWGRASNGIDFQGGTLCVGGSLTRAGLQLSQGTAGTCGGTYAFSFTGAYASARGVMPYDTLYAQWIARDAANPDGTGWSLSNALEFTMLP